MNTLFPWKHIKNLLQKQLKFMGKNLHKTHFLHLQLYNGYQVFPGGKVWLGCDADP